MLHFEVSASNSTVFKMVILQVWSWQGHCWQYCQAFDVQHPSLLSGFHPRHQVSVLALRFPSWCWQGFHLTIRFTSQASQASQTREVQPDVSTGGLLSTYPTHISEFQERILKNPMTNERPARPLPLTTLLDFHIVCITVRWVLSFSRSNYNLGKKITRFSSFSGVDLFLIG